MCVIGPADYLLGNYLLVAMRSSNDLIEEFEIVLILGVGDPADLVEPAAIVDEIPL
jgi:hypothetical protein